jgi:hypothetical protein
VTKTGKLCAISTVQTVAGALGVRSSRRYFITTGTHNGNSAVLVPCCLVDRIVPAVSKATLYARTARGKISSRTVIAFRAVRCVTIIMITGFYQAVIALTARSKACFLAVIAYRAVRIVTILMCACRCRWFDRRFDRRFNWRFDRWCEVRHLYRTRQGNCGCGVLYGAEGYSPSEEILRSSCRIVRTIVVCRLVRPSYRQ